jgi:hypothetical protein
MKVFKTDSKVHSDVKDFCKKNDIFMQEFIDTSLMFLIKKEKHYFMKELLQELSKLITLKESNKAVLDLVYVDFQYDTEQPINMDPDTHIIAPNVSCKRLILDLEKFENLEHARKFITGDFINTIREQAYLNRSSCPYINGETTIFDLDSNFCRFEPTDGLRNYFQLLSRKLSTKINTCSNYLATEGRIGPSNGILINPKWLKYKNINPYFYSNKLNNKIRRDEEIIFKDSGTISGMTIIADSRIKEDEFILYRKNNPDQPGVIGIWSLNDVGYNELLYITTTIGYHPEKQCMIIKLISK